MDKTKLRQEMTNAEILRLQTDEIWDWVARHYDCEHCPDVDNCFEGDICIYRDSQHKLRSKKSQDETRRLNLLRMEKGTYKSTTWDGRL